MGIELVPQWWQPDSYGELTVKRALERAFHDAERVLVLAGNHYFDGSAHGQYDFIVCIPEVGIAVLEVKDSQLKFEGGTWQQLNRKTRQFDPTHPHEQLRTTIKAVTRALKSANGWHSPMPPILGWLVTPDSEFAADFECPVMPRELIIDRTDLPDIATIITLALQEELSSRMAERAFTSADTARIRARFAPPEEDYEQFVGGAARRGRMVDRMSRAQATVLQIVDDNPRLYVHGGPGTGKSVLAIEQALRLAGDGSAVALLSFNRGLAEHQRLQIERSNARLKPGFVGNIYDHLPAHLGVRLPAVPEDAAERSEHFGVKVPRLMVEFLSRQSVPAKFDAIVIDEAQDLGEHAWTVVQQLLREPERGIIHAFGDPAQDMWGQGGGAPGFWARARLHENLRCTKRIAEFIQTYDPDAPSPLSIDPGYQVETLRVAGRAEVESAAMKYAELLAGMYGWERGDVAVLSTGPHLAEYTRQRGSGDEQLVDYWRTCFAGTDIFYGSTLSFKGLDRPAVVLALNGFPADADVESILLVGISRARDHLTIVGTDEDLQRLKAALADTVPAE